MLSHFYIHMHHFLSTDSVKNYYPIEVELNRLIKEKKFYRLWELGYTISMTTKGGD